MSRLGLLFALAVAWAQFGFAGPSAHASLSPDGKLQAYECETLWGLGICLKDVATNISRELIRLPGHNHHPVFSPDGLFVAFLTEVSGRQLVNVTDHVGHSWPVVEGRGIEQVIWSPDAAWLMMTPQRLDGNTDLFRITAGGTDAQWLTETAHLSETSPHFNREGKICYRLYETASGDEREASCFALE